MVSVMEVAETLVGPSGSLGDIDVLKDEIMDALVSLGASPNADPDFDGPRRKHIYGDDEMAEQLVERYLGAVPHVGEVCVVKEAIERGLKKIGRI